jgi:hypothetical protein
MSNRTVWSLPNRSRWNRAASVPTSSISSSSDTKVPARLLIGTGSPPRKERDPLVDHDLDGVWIEPEPLRGAADARDIAVVIGTPHVDQVVEPACELVDQVRTVGAEVRVSPVAPDEDTILVVPNPVDRNQTAPSAS